VPLLRKGRKKNSVELHQKSEGANPRGYHPKQWLTPILLLTLREGPSYGYEMLDQLVSSFGVGKEITGTVYRTLRRMEKDNLVRSSWERSGSGPARRVYAITDLGEANLDSWAEVLKESRDQIDEFLELYDEGKGARRGVQPGED
jgi:PadR family transcriptional regulator PadR